MRAPSRPPDRPDRDEPAAAQLTWARAKTRKKTAATKFTPVDGTFLYPLRRCSPSVVNAEKIPMSSTP